MALALALGLHRCPLFGPIAMAFLKVKCSCCGRYRGHLVRTGRVVRNGRVMPAGKSLRTKMMAGSNVGKGGLKGQKRRRKRVRVKKKKAPPPLPYWFLHVTCVAPPAMGTRREGSSLLAARVRQNPEVG